MGVLFHTLLFQCYSEFMKKCFENFHIQLKCSLQNFAHSYSQSNVGICQTKHFSLMTLYQNAIHCNVHLHLNCKQKSSVKWAVSANFASSRWLLAVKESMRLAWMDFIIFVILNMWLPCDISGVSGIELPGDRYSLPWWRHQNGNSLSVTGPLCGEFIGHRWIPLTKTSDMELSCFIWSVPEQTVEETIERSVIWDAIVLIMISL